MKITEDLNENISNETYREESKKMIKEGEHTMGESKKKLENEALEKVTGGFLYLDGMPDTCKHPNKVRVGGEREDSRYIFWSQHQFQYYCPDCGLTFWVDED